MGATRTVVPPFYFAIVRFAKICVSIGMLACQGTPASGPCPAPHIVAEVTLRRMATRVVTPKYPAEAVEAKIQGIAIADICVPAGGKVAVINEVRAPNERIAAEVTSSLLSWEFGPMWAENDPKHLFSYGGTIIYYFVHQKGQWLVLNPSDSFYVGPEFTSKGVGGSRARIR